MLSHEEIPGTVVLKTSGNPGSEVAQGPRFPGGMGVVFQLPSMEGARILIGNFTQGIGLRMSAKTRQS